jgi:Mg2+ and Co2+ transporter CorA
MIASFWGMNVGGLPFAASSSGFWIVMALSGALSGVTAFILWRKKMF